MSLSKTITEGNDYKIVSQAVWQKLLNCFGGAPEITFFMNES